MEAGRDVKEVFQPTLTGFNLCLCGAVIDRVGPRRIVIAINQLVQAILWLGGISDRDNLNRIYMDSLRGGLDG